MVVKETREEELSLEEEPVAELEHKALSSNNDNNNPHTCKVATAFWSPPVQRQRWTDHQEHPVVQFGDVFFDLFFVGAAYNLGNIIKESPTTDGVLFFVGCFFPIMDLWCNKLTYDSRYFIRSNDIWHQFVEVLSLCVLASAVVHVRPVDSLLHTRDHGEMFAFSLSLLLGALIHCVVLLELVLKVQGGPEAYYAARRDLSMKLVTAGFYTAACVVSGLDYYSNDNESSSGENYVPIILCLMGGLSINVLMGVILFFFFPNDGSHKNYAVPMNVDFCIHRYGEWIMLMLGESVLSLLIVDVSDEETYYVNFFAGVISVVLLQYMHFRSQPHHAEDHAMRRSKEAGFLFYILLQVYSAALIVLGVSYKMLLYEYTYTDSNGSSYYEEDAASSSYGYDGYDSSYGDDGDKNTTSDYAAAADSDHHYARFLAGASTSKYTPEDRQQRLAHFFSASLAIVFVCSDAMILTHKGLSTNLNRCQCEVTHRTNLVGVVLVLARLGLIVVVATLSQYVTEKEKIALIGWACIVAQLILRGISNKVFPDKQKTNACASNNPHGSKEEHHNANSGADSHEHNGNTDQYDEQDSDRWPNTTQARASRTFDGSGPLLDETTATVDD